MRSIGRDAGRSFRRELLLLLIPDALFTALILTNDCHQLVFGFQPDFENWSGDYTQLPLFFVLYGWMAVQYVGALGVIFYKCRISRSHRLVWLPVIWVLAAKRCILTTVTQEEKSEPLKLWRQNITLIQTPLEQSEETGSPALQYIRRHDRPL